MKKHIIGIDFGGTNIKMGVVNPDGKIISREHIDTLSCVESKTKLIKSIVLHVERIIEKSSLKKKDISGIGMGLPGLINPMKGVVTFLPNVPGWKNVPLKKIMEKALNIPTFIDNDVNLITLGEWKYGAGKGYDNLVCLTLGTGVGSGLILNGSLYRGEGFVAGELGHMPLNEKGPVCNCNGIACLECYVGNQRLLAQVGKLFKNKNITLKDVFELANQSNVRAIQFWEEVAGHIGNALVGVVNLLNPRVIIIGGGVANTYKYLNGTISRILNERAMSVQSKMVKISKAKIGDDAGIIGAQILIKDQSFA